MSKKGLVLRFFLIFIIYSVPSYAKHADFEWFCVHKCGTHVMLKLFDLVKKKDKSHPIQFESYYHPSSVPKAKFHKICNRKKVILCIRDPRAFVVSLKFYLDKRSDNPDHMTDRSKINRWKSLSEKDKLQAAITLDETILPFRVDALKTDWERALSIMDRSNVLVVRFENLCGEKGGGSESLQRKEIRKIFDFIDYEFNDELLDFLVENLWGKQLYDPGNWHVRNFRKGKIDDWKQYFTPDIEVLFKVSVKTSHVDYESDFC